MLNYIKAELYRNFNRAYYWGYIGVLSALGIVMNIISLNGKMNVNLKGMFEFFTIILGAGMFLVLPIMDMVTAEERKNETLKNIVSFGVSRNKLVLSKIISTIILSLIAVIVILSTFFGSAVIIFGIGQDFSLNVLNTFMIKLLVSIILWTAAVSMGIFISFFFKSNVTFTFVYIGLFSMSKNIIKLLTTLVSDKFKYISNILITTQFDKISPQSATNDTLIFASLVGAVYIIVFTILTMLYVRKMEVK
ncbi:ABC transporter permease [Clostridium brassicae]|uniref:ABC transporter permease n=1 Tax=Clostridium brassicae TaxID=2999072 RepID=A0ABT4DDM3_9CLOT|nr:ABC transporter permease [Clostridium brassicae]MCY6960410.1 ABC transporter permease [Clostridium brassicae]